MLEWRHESGGAYSPSARCLRAPGARPRRRHGHHDPGAESRRGGFRRAALRGLQRAPEPHAPRRDRRHPRGLPRRGRGSHLDQYLRLCPRMCLPNMALPIACHEITLAAARLAREAADRRLDAASGRASSLGAMGPGTRTITVTGGVTFDEVLDALLPPGPRADRGRGGRSAARDRQDTLNVKAAAIGVRRAMAEAGAHAAAHGQRHHRAHGHDAGGAGGRRALRLARAPRPLLRRAQLRHGPRVHDRPPAHARRASRRASSPCTRTRGCRTSAATTRRRRRAWRSRCGASSRRAGSTWSAAAAARRRRTSRRSRASSRAAPPRRPAGDAAPRR